MPKPSALVIYVLSLILIAGCDPQKTNTDDHTTIKPIRHEANAQFPGWENYFFSKDDCQCVNGDDFFISVKEDSPKTSNLMISLQGGGACWPGKIRCKTDASSEDVQVAGFTSELIEKLSEPWNQVVIPYCDGSVYMGGTQQDYDGDNKTDHWHSGVKNSIAALDLVQEKFPDVSKIFLTGCSAGGYGTIVQLRLLRQRYPDAHIYVLNESGPGLMRPDPEFWEMIDTSWDLTRIMPRNCIKCDGQLIYWYEDMLQDPKIKIALYSAYRDHVIGEAFLEMEPSAYEALLLETSQELNTKYPDQFKRFFINGNSHCIDDRSYAVRGIVYWDWVLAMMNDSENWQDVLE